MRRRNLPADLHSKSAPSSAGTFQCRGARRKGIGVRGAGWRGTGPARPGTSGTGPGWSRPADSYPPRAVPEVPDGASALGPQRLGRAGERWGVRVPPPRARRRAPQQRTGGAFAVSHFLRQQIPLHEPSPPSERAPSSPGALAAPTGQFQGGTGGRFGGDLGRSQWGQSSWNGSSGRGSCGRASSGGVAGRGHGRAWFCCGGGGGAGRGCPWGGGGGACSGSDAVVFACRG